MKKLKSLKFLAEKPLFHSSFFILHFPKAACKIKNTADKLCLNYRRMEKRDVVISTFQAGRRALPGIRWGQKM